MKLIGLTGGICSGKSTVSKIFIEAGFDVLDFDILATELRDTNEEVQERLIEAFGTYDRFALRNIVFGNKEKISKVNNIFFEHIISLAYKKTEESKAPVVVWDSALLLDFPDELIPEHMEHIYVVHCPREIRKARLVQRPKVSEEVAEQILNIQISDDKRLKLAKDYDATVLRSDGNIEDLRASVKDIVKAILLP